MDSMTEPSAEPHLLIEPAPGYSLMVGQLVSMMDYARKTTLEAVHGLMQAELDYLLDEQANSIAMLLEHIPSVEEYYQYRTFGLRIAPQGQERSRLGADLGAEARSSVRNQPLEYYLGRMAVVRSRTLGEFAKRDDAWLLEATPFRDGALANNYWKWFHVMEDELSHRGQIRLIRKRLPKLPRA